MDGMVEKWVSGYNAKIVRLFCLEMMSTFQNGCAVERHLRGTKAATATLQVTQSTEVFVRSLHGNSPERFKKQDQDLVVVYRVAIFREHKNK